MNPKLHKERIRTSAQRPDIVIAFQNYLRTGAAGRVAQLRHEEGGKESTPVTKTA